MSPDKLEALAIKCALGNNGGVWAEHYTGDQKAFWRGFAQELVLEVSVPENDTLLKKESAAIVWHPEEGYSFYMPTLKPEDPVPEPVLLLTATMIRIEKEPGFAQELLHWFKSQPRG